MIGLELTLIVLLLMVNGLLAMTEIAVVSARKGRLQQRSEDGDAGARAALLLAEEPTRFLSTVQIGITLVGILTGAFGGATLAAQIDAWLEDVPGLGAYSEVIGLGAVVLLITYLSLVIGELVPKRIGMSRPEAIAAALARPMATISRLATPAVWVLTTSTDGLLRLLRLRQAADSTVTEEEIRFVVEQGAETGAIKESERSLVDRVLDLAGRRVAEIMTPRVDVTWLDLSASPQDVIRLVSAAGYAYLPVCRGTVDDVAGILATRDVLVRHARGAPIDLPSLIHPPLFVPETLRCLELLDRFRSQAEPHGTSEAQSTSSIPAAHPTLALVIGEHGGVEGLITLADVLAAIVGELPNGGTPETTRLPDGTLTVAGTLALAELEELLDTELPDTEDVGRFSTVGGLAMFSLERVPAEGDTFVWCNHQFSVISMDRNRVARVLVRATS